MKTTTTRLYWRRQHGTQPDRRPDRRWLGSCHVFRRIRSRHRPAWHSAQRHFQVNTDTRQPGDTGRKADVVVLAVKPQIMRDVAHSIAAECPTMHAPGYLDCRRNTRSDLDRWLGGNCALVRCMPNTPALVQSGATALFAIPESISRAERSGRNAYCAPSDSPYGSTMKT